MKKIIIIMAFLLLTAGILSAVEVTIGDDTTYNTSYGYPAVYGNYYRNDREQYLITAGELNSAGGGGGDITSIAFNVYTLNSVGARPMVIKMGHTANALYGTSDFVTGLTTVKTYSTYTPALGWNVHTLDTAFPWNGSQSLIVEVFYGDLALGYTNNTSTYYTATTNYQALYYRNDTIDANTATTGTRSYNRPNMRFEMAAYVPAVPGPASIVSPLDGAMDISPLATLNWTAGSGLPTGYNLYFGDEDGDANPPWDISQDMFAATTYDPADMALGDTYYWKIVPYNGVGPAENCPVWSFTIHTGQPTLFAPSNNAIDQALTNLNFSWNAVPTAISYKIKIGSTSGGSDIANVDPATSPYTYTGTLNYSTPYYWSVTAVFADLSEIQSVEWMFTTAPDPTIYPDACEDFGTTTVEWPVYGWTQLTGLYGSETPVTGGSWYQDDFCNVVTDPMNKSARLNIWSTSTKSWLVTPPVVIPSATGYELKFDLGLTTYGGTVSPTPGNQADDKFIVLMADDAMMTTNLTLLKEWNNTGSANVYDDISNTGETHIIPINVAGTKYFAFYGESTVSGGDNNVYVDNACFRATPQTAVFSIAPELTAWDFGLVPVGGTAEKEFAVSNTGTGHLNVSSITQTGTNPPFSIFPTPALPWSLTNADPANTFKVVFTPQTAGGPYSTDVTVNYTSGAKETYTISFTGSAYQPATLPLTEGWESGQGNWSFVNGTQTNAWYIGAGDATYTPYAGSNFAYISNDGGNSVSYTVSSTSVSHIYTDIAFDADCLEFPLSFYWRCQGEGTAWDRMRVHLVDTSVTPVAGTELTTGQVGLTNYNLQPAWTAESITLPGTLSGTVKRLVFSWKNDSSGGTNPPINLDNISLIAVPEPSGPVLAPNLDYPADTQPDLPVGGFPFEFSWNTGGSEPDVYNLYLAKVSDLTIYPYDSDEFFSVAETFYDVDSPYTPTYAYDYDGVYVWTVGAYNATYPDEVFQWPPYEFTIETDPTIYVPPTYTVDFETWPPADWNMSAGTGTIYQYLDGNGNNWALYNYWSQYYDVTDIMVSPPLHATQPVVLEFTWSHLYSASYPDDYLSVDTSTDGSTWNPLWSRTGPAFDSADGAGSMAPGTGVQELLVIPHTNVDFWLRFNGVSGYGPDLFIDDVILRVPPENDIAVTAIVDLPASQYVGTTYYPKATVKNNGTLPASFTVNMAFGSYTSDALVTDLAFGASTTVAFDSWTPANVGPYSVTVTAPYTGDANPADNILAGSFNVLDYQPGYWASGVAIPASSYLGSAGSYIDASGNGHILTIAGNSSLGTEFQDYDINANTWASLTPLPANRVVQASVVAGNFFYVIGGSDGTNYHSTMYRYDLNGGSWTTLTALPEALAWCKAVSYQDAYIYVVGGVDATDLIMNDVYYYDIAAGAWYAASPLPLPTFGGACAITGNKIVYVAGAQDPGIVNTVYVGTITTDPAVITWATRASYPGLATASPSSNGHSLAETRALPSFKAAKELMRTYPSGAMYRFDGTAWGANRIIVAGGSPSADWIPASPGKAYLYDPATDIWTALPDLTVPVLGAYMSAVQSDPYTWTAVVASGYTGSTVTSETQFFQISSAAVLDIPDISVTTTVSGILISWPHVIGAVAYDVYASNDPYTADWGTPLTTVYTPGYTYTGTASYQFFRIVARSVAP